MLKQNTLSSKQSYRHAIVPERDLSPQNEKTLDAMVPALMNRVTAREA